MASCSNLFRNKTAILSSVRAFCVNVEAIFCDSLALKVGWDEPLIVCRASHMSLTTMRTDSVYQALKELGRWVRGGSEISSPMH